MGFRSPHRPFRGPSRGPLQSAAGSPPTSRVATRPALGPQTPNLEATRSNLYSRGEHRGHYGAAREVGQFGGRVEEDGARTLIEVMGSDQDVVGPGFRDRLCPEEIPDQSLDRIPQRRLRPPREADGFVAYKDQDDAG